MIVSGADYCLLIVDDDMLIGGFVLSAGEVLRGVCAFFSDARQDAHPPEPGGRRFRLALAISGSCLPFSRPTRTLLTSDWFLWGPPFALRHPP